MHEIRTTNLITAMFASPRRLTGGWDEQHLVCCLSCYISRLPSSHIIDSDPMTGPACAMVERKDQQWRMNLCAKTQNYSRLTWTAADELSSTPNRRSCFTIAVYQDAWRLFIGFSSHVVVPPSSAYGFSALLAKASIIKPCKSNCCAWTLTKHNKSQMATTNCHKLYNKILSQLWNPPCVIERTNICSLGDFWHLQYLSLSVICKSSSFVWKTWNHNFCF